MKESPPSLLGLSTLLSKQALKREEVSKSECLLQIILGSTDFSLPPPTETQHPYSKKEPFDKKTGPLLLQPIFQPNQGICLVQFLGDPLRRDEKP